MIYRRVFGVPSMRFHSPFSELERMRDQMDRLMGAYAGESIQGKTAGVFPLVNLTEDASSYYVRAELPGIKANEINIQAERNSVSISGARKTAPGQEDVKFHRRERDTGTFSRVIGLPGEVDPDKVEANLAHGLLTIAIPKSEAAKPKQIKVN